MRSVVEEHRAETRFCHWDGLAQRYGLCPGLCIGPEVHYTDAVGEVLGHADFRADDGQPSGTIAGEFQPLTDARHEGQVVRDVPGRVHGVSNMQARRGRTRRHEVSGRFERQQPRVELPAVDHAYFMGARMGDNDLFTVGRAGDAGGIGCTVADIVEQDRVDVPLLGDVDDRHHVGIDPASFEIVHRESVAGQDVCDVGVPAVRRDRDSAKARAAVGQFDIPDDAQRSRVDHGDD